ncbi:hypothetical protein [Cryptosporangium sp. NPDC051539]|uniref:hypothetical protein n=1 Tax=Cryptosporangium sp. NPDC051539 TaxID=3363962 RepID=UPI0037880342
MGLNGTYADLLTMSIGATVPASPSPSFLQSVREVRVTRTESGRAAFQLLLALEDGSGSDGRRSALDKISDDELKPFNRVVLSLAVNGSPVALFDGVTTHREVTADEHGAITVVLTGEDLTVALDREERSAEYPGQDEEAIVNTILARYASRYRLRSDVTPPPGSSAPTDHQVPVQQSTDLEHLLDLAARHDFVFRIDPGLKSPSAYWGPRRTGLPRAAGPIRFAPEQANAERLRVRVDGLYPVRVKGLLQDPESGSPVTVDVVGLSDHRGSDVPLWETYPDHIRSERYRRSGLSTSDATTWATGRGAATAEAVTLTGVLNTASYGAVLPVPGVVSVLGAGGPHDGDYRIVRVTHTITLRDGLHRQEFTLVRPGLAEVRR